MSTEEASGPALGGIGEADASQLAAMVGQVPDEQLAEGMSDPEGRKLVLDEIEARGGRALPRPFGVATSPVAAQHLDAGVRLEPVGQGLTLAVGQQLQRPRAL